MRGLLLDEPLERSVRILCADAEGEKVATLETLRQKDRGERFILPIIFYLFCLCIFQFSGIYKWNQFYLPSTLLFGGRLY